MNKHHGSKFDTYLKQKGTFEEVNGLTQKRWEELQTGARENVSEITEDSPGHLVRFFRWFSQATQVLR